MHCVVDSCIVASNKWMYEEPLLGGAKGKTSGHAQHLDKFLYADDDNRANSSSHRHQQQQDAADLRAAIHQLNSFFAVLWPVCITMICARCVWACAQSSLSHASSHHRADALGITLIIIISLSLSVDVHLSASLPATSTTPT